MNQPLPGQPCLLAFDTSTEQLALALVCPAGVFTHAGAGGAQASASLLPQALALLQQGGVGMAQLQAVAFGRGPGAFTGLRTSCAVAQGLAFGIGCPVLPLDSLMLVAEDAFTQARDTGQDDDGAFEVAVAMDARMDEAYAGRYRRVGGEWPVLQGFQGLQAWQVVDSPALYTLPALSDTWAQQPPEWVAGSAVAAFAGRLPFPPAARCLRQEASRAAALASLALAAWARGDAIDPALALPIYLRDKVAQTTAERLAARGAA